MTEKFADSSKKNRICQGTHLHENFTVASRTSHYVEELSEQVFC